MTKLEDEIKDMIRAEKMLIELSVTAYHAFDRDDYQAVKILMAKCDDHARKARRKLRHINRTNNEDNQ